MFASSGNVPSATRRSTMDLRWLDGLGLRGPRWRADAEGSEALRAMAKRAVRVSMVVKDFISDEKKLVFG